MISEELKVTIETIVNSYIHDKETGKTNLDFPSYMQLIGLTSEQIDYAKQVFNQKIKSQPNQPYIDNSEYRKKQINNIINLTGNNGEQIDIFNLHGILYIGNTKNRYKPEICQTFRALSSYSSRRF